MKIWLAPLLALLCCTAPCLAQEAPTAGDDGSDDDAMAGMDQGAMDHAAMEGIAGPSAAGSDQQPHGREGSGTSWMPDQSQVFAHHAMAGDWMLMLHYLVLAGYDDQLGERGSRRFASTNWVMGMAQHPLFGGQLLLRSMLSAEPATAAGPTQLPLLLQTGETYAGAPLHDRQHPHDLFMELAAVYRRPLAGGVGLELYAAPSGEPALGPTAFMHRSSAMGNPFPPITHHWQDSTHISFPVLTAGLHTSTLKLEGSLFHGREPDENRWDLDLGALDSWAVRASANPIPALSLQLSYGYLHSPEATAPEESEHRLTGSAQWSQPAFAGGNLALTVSAGENLQPGASTGSLLFEAEADLDGHDVPFARLELVEKLGKDLVVPGDPEHKFMLAQAELGYLRRLPQLGPVVPVVGAALNLARVPDELQGIYGSQFPGGGFAFIGLQPPLATHAHEHHHHPGMEGM